MGSSNQLAPSDTVMSRAVMTTIPSVADRAITDAR
jgi:hypothetical protein